MPSRRSVPPEAGPRRRVVRSAAVGTPAYAEQRRGHPGEPAGDHQAGDQHEEPDHHDRQARADAEQRRADDEGGQGDDEHPDDRAEAAADPLDDAGHGIILTAATPVIGGQHVVEVEHVGAAGGYADSLNWSWTSYAARSGSARTIRLSGGSGGGAIPTPRATFDFMSA